MKKRIIIGLLPLLILLLVVGCYAVSLFARLGGAIDTILRENYRSIVAAQNMKESAERMDSALFFTLAGEQERALKMFRENLPIFQENLHAELNNITLPGEGELAGRLNSLWARYMERAKVFLDTQDVNKRQQMYFDQMLPTFTEMKNTADAILKLNQDNMLKADGDARALSRHSTRYMAAAIAAGLAVSGFFGWKLLRSIVHPIRTLTDFSKELGEGNLDQVVPVLSDDELGVLADSFNKMASKVRAYRQVTSDEILQARQMTQITFSAFPDPIMALDSKGTINFKNPAAENLLLGLRLDDRLPEQISEQVRIVLQGGEDYIPANFASAICVRPNDKETFFLPRVIGIRDETGAVHGAAIVLQNVTRLRLADDLKTHLVSTVSHELKTPLTSVRMALHLLLEESVGTLTPKQTELLIAARDDSERLLGMINNLLDLARLESGAAHMLLEPASPRELVSEAIEANKDTAEHYGVRLVAKLAEENLPDVAVEPQQIAHVFSNLITNAAKYSPPADDIVLRASREEGGVRFAVVDKGKGIEPKFQPYLFEQFYRVPGTERTGAGLGLSIAREIVRAHHGSIGVKSQQGEGAEFYFDLPLAGTTTRPGSPAPARHSPATHHGGQV